MINRRKLRKFLLVLGGIGVAVLAACLGLFYYSWPRPVWIIEDRYVQAWEKILANSPSPLLNAKIVPVSAAASAAASASSLSRSWYGYRIDSKQEPPVSVEVEQEGPIRVYRGLRSEAQGEIFPLAYDPWLVFRKFTSPPLTREEAEKGSGGNGLLMLAGGDRAAVLAWDAQLLQDTPGVFLNDELLWEQTEKLLLMGNFFQHGAITYGWSELWPYLLGDEVDVRVYAPLSRIRQLPGHQTNILEADVFPGRRGWNQFGIQADILWAAPYGSWKNREKLKPVDDWLRSVEFQTLLANALGWLSAHPESPPYNPVTGRARIYYLTASYMWTVKEWQNN